MLQYCISRHAEQCLPVLGMVEHSQGQGGTQEGAGQLLLAEEEGGNSSGKD